MVPILIQSFSMFFWFLRMLILIRIILSWLAMGGGGGSLFKIVWSLTEPLLSPIRNLIQKSPLGGPGMVIDFSPIIFVLILTFLEMFIVNFLSSL